MKYTGRKGSTRVSEPRQPRIRTSEEAAKLFDWIRKEPKELLVALYLDARGHVIHRETVSMGTATSSLVPPREVFAPAIAAGAIALIVAHNHPSGDPTPSRDDRNATSRLRAAGELLGIELLDHIIMVEGGFFSFREAGFPGAPLRGGDLVAARRANRRVEIILVNPPTSLEQYGILFR